MNPRKHMRWTGWIDSHPRIHVEMTQKEHRPTFWMVQRLLVVNRVDKTNRWWRRINVLLHLLSAFGFGRRSVSGIHWLPDADSVSCIASSFILVISVLRFSFILVNEMLVLLLRTELDSVSAYNLTMVIETIMFLFCGWTVTIPPFSV